MTLALQKAVAFVADFERQYAWYVRVAGWGVAERYLAAVDNTLQLLAAHPAIGRVRRPLLCAFASYALCVSLPHATRGRYCRKKRKDAKTQGREEARHSLGLCGLCPLR